MKIQWTAAAGSILAGVAVAGAAIAQTTWPQVTRADIEVCRTQIAQVHQLELAYFRSQISRYCTPGTQFYSAHNCGVFQQELSESISQNDLDWYWKGNGSCGGGDYPCFGVEVLNDVRNGEEAKRWTEIFMQNAAQGDTITPGMDLWEAANKADNCTTAIWVRKYKGGGASPAPAAPQQVAAAPGPAAKPTSANDPAFKSNLQTFPPDQLVQLAQELLMRGEIDMAKLARNALLARFPDSPLVPTIVDMLVAASRPGVTPAAPQQVQPSQTASAAPAPTPAFTGGAPRINVYDAASLTSAFAQVGYALVPGAQANQLKDAQNRFSAYFLDCNGTRCGAIQLLADYNISPMPSADRVMQWNRDKLYGRGYISNGMVDFDMVVKIPSNGIEPHVLKEQLDLFLAATSIFYNFVQYR
jgi:hypothetical protein